MPLLLPEIRAGGHIDSISGRSRGPASSRPATTCSMRAAEAANQPIPRQVVTDKQYQVIDPFFIKSEASSAWMAGVLLLMCPMDNGIHAIAVITHKILESCLKALNAYVSRTTACSPYPDGLRHVVHSIRPHKRHSQRNKCHHAQQSHLLAVLSHLLTDVDKYQGGVETSEPQHWQTLVSVCGDINNGAVAAWIYQAACRVGCAIQIPAGKRCQAGGSKLGRCNREEQVWPHVTQRRCHTLDEC